jgi:PAS domain S-box-containing protein
MARLRFRTVRRFFGHRGTAAPRTPADAPLEALIRHAPFGVCVVDADLRLVLVNDAARPAFAGIEPLLGRDIGQVLRALWPEPVAREIVARYRHTLATGRPATPAPMVARRADRGQVEAYDWHLERIVLSDGRHGVACYFHDVTAQQRWAGALMATEERVRLLLHVSDAVRSEADPRRIVVVALEALRAHLDLDRVAWADVEEDEDHFVFLGCATRDGVPPVEGRYSVSAFGPAGLLEMRGGRPLVVDDARELPEGADRAAYEATGIGALVAMPIHKAGRFTAVIGLHMRGPRRWTPADIELARLVAERVWEAVERARAAKALAESESFYRQTVESIRGIVFTTLPDGQCDFVNTHWIEHTGKPEAEHLGHGWAASIHPSDRPGALAAWRDAVARGAPYETEYRVRRADGTYEWFKVHAHAIRDAEGRIVRWFGTGMSIDAQKRTEAALVARERELQSLADNAPVLIARYDRALRHVFVNAAVERALGMPAAAILGKTHRELGFPEVWAAPIERVLTEGTPATDELEVELAQGRRRLSGHVVPERADDGHVSHALAVVRDVTEARAAEDAVRVSEERLATAQRAAGFGVFDWNIVTDAATWTEEAWQLFEGGGAPRGPVTYARWQACVHPDDRPRVIETAEAALAGQRAYRDEYRVVYRDGTTVWVEAAGDVLRDAEGRPVRMIGVVRDVTERKRAEDALRQADRRKDEFLATLAHELRNPLAPIRTGLQLMKLVPPDAPAALRAREMMERQLGHLVRLVDDLLDVSRVSRGKVELQRARISLDAVVHHAVEATRPIVEASRHTLDVRLPERPVWIDGDLTRLAQVVGNLLNNAAKYTPQGGHLRVEAEAEGEHAVLRVSDDGVGLPPEMITRVFDLFTQSEHTRERAQGGLGIGLSLAKKLVELHGGTVEAASPGLGRGSTFTVRLPRVDAGEPAAERAREAPRGGVGRRVLVVDDNVDGAQSMGMVLELLGHEVRLAHDGLEALELARAFRPEVAVLDIGLPGMSGYELARRFRAEPALAQTLLIALTGWGSEDDQRKSAEAGFDAHLTKPVDGAAVQQALAATVRAR